METPHLRQILYQNKQIKNSTKKKEITKSFGNF